VRPLACHGYFYALFIAKPKAACELRLSCAATSTQFFAGRMPFLTPNQQRQSTEGRFKQSSVNIRLLSGPVLSGRGSVTILDKVFIPMCPCHQVLGLLVPAKAEAQKAIIA